MLTQVVDVGFILGDDFFFPGTLWLRLVTFTFSFDLVFRGAFGSILRLLAFPFFFDFVSSSATFFLAAGFALLAYQIERKKMSVI